MRSRRRDGGSKGQREERGEGVIVRRSVYNHSLCMTYHVM